MGCTKTYHADKSYDGILQAVMALTVNKILKTRILSKKFLQIKMKAFSSFLPNALI